MNAPNKIIELVERFNEKFDRYQRKEYKEANVQDDFIEPFFEELGWDIHNRQGAFVYRDVIREYRIETNGTKKFPDYCFCVGGKRKFFVETKPPHKKLDTDKDPAYQLRRYGWSANLPLSILTDFEKFVVYRCDVEPNETDHPTICRIDELSFSYNDYPNKWNIIANIFHRDSIFEGSIEKFTETIGKKRNTLQVDDKFLKDIDNWRELLANNIAEHNSNIRDEQLKFAVQSIIDRIVFLRICEDREIESENQLKSLLEYKNIYDELKQLFYKADSKYNSSLFYFKKEKGRNNELDTLTPDLIIDSKVLRQIIENLYLPKSPYVFSVISVDILGQVYEQFLGKVIRLTPQVKIEEKKEVKKAGGIYYTPKYIVDYIVENTVGKLCEKKKPEEIAKLRILDPACGSGSFLISAYTYLLNYHLELYCKNKIKKYRNRIYQGKNKEWCLTIEEKRRILLNNIYGVDIDEQAIEVAKLNLYLKLLEGENQEVLKKQLEFQNIRALPDLGNNIKCGNSLIGHDFYQIQLHLLSNEEKRRINTFDWDGGFPHVMVDGGFDAVIGNPPYNAFLSNEEEFYLQEKYAGVKTGRQDTAAVFVELASNISHGLVMFLLPYRLISRKRNHGCFQRWLYDNTHIQQIVYVGKIKEIKVNDEFMIGKISHFKNGRTSSLAMEICPQVSKQELIDNTVPLTKVTQTVWGPPDYNLNIRVMLFDYSIIKKIKADSILLGEIAECKDGIVPHIRDKLLSQNKKDYRYKPLLGIRGFYSLQRYFYEWKDIYICYDINEAKKYIKDKKELQKVQLRDEQIFIKSEKILTAQDSITIKGTLDTDQFYTTNSIHTTYLKDSTEDYNIHYVLGLLNSKTINYYHQSLVLKGQDLHPQILVSNLRKLPIHIINFVDQKDKSYHDQIVKLANNMLALNKKLTESKTPNEKKYFKRQIKMTDNQIDRLVYELYGLTDEEIAIIEKEMDV